MSILRGFYLLLAIAGVCIPWYFNIQFMQSSGGLFDLASFVAATTVNAAASSLSWDLTIACVAGLIWMYHEARRLSLRFYWLYFLATFTIAYAFAFPLFLFVRQGVLDRQQAA